MGPFEINCVKLGSFFTLSNHFVPFRTIADYCRSFHTIWAHFGTFLTIGNRFPDPLFIFNFYHSFSICIFFFLSSITHYPLSLTIINYPLCMLNYKLFISIIHNPLLIIHFQSSITKYPATNILDPILFSFINHSLSIVNCHVQPFLRNSFSVLPQSEN